jgi:hypothetical protein
MSEKCVHPGASIIELNNATGIIRYKCPICGATWYEPLEA